MDALKRFAARYGGQLELDDSAAPSYNLFKFILQQCEESLQVPRNYLVDPDKLGIEFCFTMEPAFAAHCMCVDGRGLITVSAIVVPKLLEMARSVVTGGAHMIPSHGTTVPFLKMDLYELMRSPSLYQELPDPNDQFLVINVVLIAIDILLNHELSHVAAGHLAWQKGKKIDGLTHKTLEWDADSLAIQRSLMRGLRPPLLPPSFNERRYAGMPPYGKYGERGQCFYSFGVAVYLIARFIQMGSLEKDVAEDYYPPAWFRIQHFFALIVHTVSSRLVPMSEEILERKVVWPMMTGACKAETAWCKATGQSSIIQQLHTYKYVEAGANLISEYELCWKSVSSQIDKYKTVPSLWDAV